MVWSLLMDGIVACLLVATIVFCLRLNARLSVLRDNRAELMELIQGLQRATLHAEEAVGGLRLSTGDAGRQLQEAIDRALGLKGDLAFLIDRASGVADRLETAIKAPREPLREPVGKAASAAPVGGKPAAEGRLRTDDSDAKGNQSRLALLLKQAESAAQRDGEEGRGSAQARAEPRPESHDRDVPRDPPIRPRAEPRGVETRGDGGGFRETEPRFADRLPEGPRFGEAAQRERKEPRIPNPQEAWASDVGRVSIPNPLNAPRPAARSGLDPRTMEPRAPEPRMTESRMTESRIPDSRIPDPRTIDPRPRPDMRAEPRFGERDPLDDPPSPDQPRGGNQQSRAERDLLRALEGRR